MLPVVIAQGAGAKMRRTSGMAVFNGMIGVTLFGIFLMPTFYSVVRWFSDRGPELFPAKEGVPLEGSSAPAPYTCVRRRPFSR
jgi:hypothetical protein